VNSLKKALNGKYQPKLVNWFFIQCMAVIPAFLIPELNFNTQAAALVSLAKNKSGKRS